MADTFRKFRHDDGRTCITDLEGRWRHWDFDGKTLAPHEGTPNTVCERAHGEDDRGTFGMPGVGPAANFMPGRLLHVQHGELSNMARRIVDIHLPRALEHFLKRNAEYGDDNDFNLGPAGQYVDISRKVQKLKRRWWDHRPAKDGEESDEVIVMELIGHLFMTLDMMDQESDGR